MAKVLSALLHPQTVRGKKEPSLAQVLKWASRFSPLTAADCIPELCTGHTEPDSRFLGINIDIAGSERLFKGEEKLLNEVAQGLHSLGFSSRVAIAPSLGCAWAISRYGFQNRTVIKKNEIKKNLAPLPVAALRISKRVEDSLSEINVLRVEELLRLSRKSLLARFDLSLLTALDRALGIQDEPLLPPHPQKTFKAEKIFNDPIEDLEVLKKAAHLLLEELLHELNASSKKISRLIIRIIPRQTPPLFKNIPLTWATCEKKHLWCILRHQMETLYSGCGVTSIALYAPDIEDCCPQPLSYLEHSSVKESHNSLFSNPELSTLLDILNSHLGEENVLRFQCRESHIPEKSFYYRPFGDDTHCSKNKTSSFVDTERPSMLFYKPQVLQTMALMPDSPPFWLKWRGESYNVNTGVGPERIAPEWWGKDESLFLTRDYFKVQIPCGTWLWIYREVETLRWFVHGVWA